MYVCKYVYITNKNILIYEETKAKSNLCHSQRCDNNCFILLLVVVVTLSLFHLNNININTFQSIRHVNFQDNLFLNDKN